MTTPTTLGDPKRRLTGRFAAAIAALAVTLVLAVGTIVYLAMELNASKIATVAAESVVTTVTETPAAKTVQTTETETETLAPKTVRVTATESVPFEVPGPTVTVPGQPESYWPQPCVAAMNNATEGLNGYHQAMLVMIQSATAGLADDFHTSEQLAKQSQEIMTNALAAKMAFEANAANCA